ncbi:hypothetical protein J3D56_001294 [Erwinia persicina]|jgi:hypothetical protein|uniref:PH domain-containing protein n=2 Tax=Erwinia TaxID=551 RepID=A0ABV4EBY7_9GAMM|nr:MULTISPECIES: hypothetical protein [Erwinia]MCP1437858.1 hypothetical protein [Erwinia persicina]MDN8541213.1 hypothetical protein [Erwinia sp. BC051422]
MRKRIPVSSAPDEENESEWISLIQRIIPKIETELTGSLLWYSQNAQYVPGSVKIISVEQTAPSGYKMTYSFCWNVFNACLDIDADETTTQSVNFESQPDALIFDFIDTERAAAADEL